MTAIPRRPSQTEPASSPLPSSAAQHELAALRRAVGMALDRKRRLGQYAVVWQGSEVRRIAPESLPEWPADSEDAGSPYGLAPQVQMVAAGAPSLQSYIKAGGPQSEGPR